MIDVQTRLSTSLSYIDTTIMAAILIAKGRFYFDCDLVDDIVSFAITFTEHFFYSFVLEQNPTIYTFLS